MKEQNILKTILLDVCRGSVRLWRSNAGQGWVGKTHHVGSAGMVKVYPGDVVVRNAQPLRAGFKGLSDLTGYVTIEVTPDMVGEKIAVFSAVEVKAARGRASKEQKSFIERVLAAGGRAGIARSSEDAKKVLQID